MVQFEWLNEEQRRELRTARGGEVRLFIEGSPSPVIGQLKDVSNCGFRAGHVESGLGHGTVVRFVHESFSGRARVMWSRIAEGAVESGFLVLSPREP